MSNLAPRVVALAALALGRPVSAEEAGPLAPAGKWTVSAADNRCVLQRVYGPADRPVVMFFTPGTLGTRIGVGLVERRLVGRMVRRDDGSVTLGDGPALPARMRGYGPVGDGGFLTTVFLNDASVRDLVLAPTLAFDRGRVGARVVIAPGGSQEAADALDRCEAERLRGLGLDPAGQPAPSQPPRAEAGGPARWFRSNDYPRAVRNLMPFGHVVARVVVDADGAVRRCVVAQGSGSAALDDKTCQILRRRARYTPALDPAGRPVAAPVVIPVNWEPSRR